ncbi:MAG: hypothetical protein WCJ84_02540 [Candidatus Peregrinibacteria bacterium]
MQKNLAFLGIFGLLFLTGCSLWGGLDAPKETTPPKLEDIFADIHSTTNVEKLSESTKSAESAVRAFSAQNVNTPPEDLWKLADDSQLAVRSYLATNPKLPPELFEKLSKDSATDVRVKIANNPGTPPAVLKKFYTDAASAVQEHLVMNKSLSEEMLLDMAKNLSATSALELLAERPKLSTAVKSALKARKIDSVNGVLQDQEKAEAEKAKK